MISSISGSVGLGGLVSAIGKTTSDVRSLPPGMKDCVSYDFAVGRALGGSSGSPFYSINNYSNDVRGISAEDLKREYNTVVAESNHKWASTESTQGSPWWGDYRQLQADMASVGFSPTYQMFHLAFGHGIYQPSWVNNALNSANVTNEQISTLIQNRINTIKAEYPSSSTFRRIDVWNEITSDLYTKGSITNADGWRTESQGNYWYKASQTAGGGGPLGKEQYIADSLSSMNSAFSGAELCIGETNLEYPCAPYEYTNGVLVPPYSGNAYDTTLTFAGNTVKLQRLKDLVYRLRSNGYPIHGISYQGHIDPISPINMVDMEAALWDWNRWGIKPKLTEFNVLNKGGATAPHVRPPIPNAQYDRIGAWTAWHYLTTFLNSSLCDELTFWTKAYGTVTYGQIPHSTGLNNNAQTYPAIRLVSMLALSQSAPPSSRTLKRGHKTDCRFFLAPYISSSAGRTTNTAIVSQRMKITGPTSLQMPWSFFNAAWMPRPISNTSLILVARFWWVATPASGTVVIGYGNGTSGSPSNTVKVISSGTALYLQIRVEGSVVLYQQLKSFVGNGYFHQLAVRIEGPSIKWSIDGSSVQAATAGGSFSDQSALYLLSNPDGTGYDENNQMGQFEVHHSEDYPTDSDLVTLGTPDHPRNKTNVVSPYYGE